MTRPIDSGVSVLMFFSAMPGSQVPDTIGVAGKTLCFKKAVIATGARAVPPQN